MTQYLIVKTFQTQGSCQFTIKNDGDYDSRVVIVGLGKVKIIALWTTYKNNSDNVDVTKVDKKMTSCKNAQ